MFGRSTRCMETWLRRFRARHKDAAAEIEEPLRGESRFLYRCTRQDGEATELWRELCRWGNGRG
jgi:hypothetical protein